MGQDLSFSSWRGFATVRGGQSLRRSQRRATGGVGAFGSFGEAPFQVTVTVKWCKVLAPATHYGPIWVNPVGAMVKTALTQRKPARTPACRKRPTTTDAKATAHTALGWRHLRDKHSFGERQLGGVAGVQPSHEGVQVARAGRHRLPADIVGEAPKLTFQ